MWGEKERKKGQHEGRSVVGECGTTQKSNNVFLYVNYLNARFSILYLIIIIMAVISIAPYLSDKGEYSMFVRLKTYVQ